MRDLLHDEKDAVQDIQERWWGVIEEIKKRLAGIANESIDFREMLTTANVLAADALAELTTEAAKRGFAFGMMRGETKKAADGSRSDKNPKG